MSLMSGAARDTPWTLKDKLSRRPEWYSGQPNKSLE